MKNEKIINKSLLLGLAFLCLSPLANAQDNEVVYEEEADEVIGLQVEVNEDLELYADETLVYPPRYDRKNFRCVAENIRRQQFYGEGATMQIARNRAVRNCDFRSANCRIIRCYRGDIRPPRPVRPGRW